MTCEICSILTTKNNHTDEVVSETAYWRAVLDPDQRTLGKMFITLLEHKETISALGDLEWHDLRILMQQLERNVMAAFQPSHFNWQCLMNNAVIARQPTHVHWHLHPRYTKPIVFAGRTFTDTELYPPKERTSHVVPHDVLRQISRAITNKGIME